MEISIEELRRAFGCEPALSASTLSKYRANDFRYTEVSPGEHQQILFEIEQKISAGFSKVGTHRADIWESAWFDVKKRFIDSNLDPQVLNPDFISNHDYVRWNGRYIRPNSRRLELSFFEVFRDWIFTNHLQEYDNVFELGSGSGFNVIELAQKFPSKKIIGYDWSFSAAEILNIYRQRTGANVTGYSLDFFKPDMAIEFPENTAIMTFCAFEQIGHHFQPMLNFLIHKRPALIIQMEPILEFYDAHDPFDGVAIKYHESRGYLTGYHTKLLELALKKKIDILHSKRLNFGSKYNECYSLHIWRPCVIT
jgi:hypothetical protein